MQKIVLTQDEIALVDDADYPFLNQWKWHVTSTKGRSATRYARRNGPRVNSPRQAILMHRVIMQAPHGMEVDHIDGNGLNNQRSNLRIVTGLMNTQNRRVHKDIRYVGVTRLKNGMFQSQIKRFGRHIYLGCFTTQEDAARAFDKKIPETDGLSAYLNFPREHRL